MNARSIKALLCATLTIGLGASQAWANETPEVSAGRRLAQRACGECHAIAETGASPLSDAPPFRLLYQRFDVANLPLALDEGMLVGHPRMPTTRLDDDEIVYLTAFLKSFITAGTPVERNACKGPAACRK